MGSTAVYGVFSIVLPKPSASFCENAISVVPIAHKRGLLPVRKDDHPGRAKCVNEMSMIGGSDKTDPSSPDHLLAQVMCDDLRAKRIKVCTKLIDQPDH